RWRRRFRSSRLPGLTDASSAIRRGRIAEERLRTVVRSTVAGRRPGGRVWSTRSLAQEFGVSHMTVQRLWEAYRIRPKRLDATPPRADPVTGARPWDVIGLSFDGPSAALALTLRPTWPGPGRAESQDDVGPAVSRRVALVLPNDYSRVERAFGRLGSPALVVPEGGASTSSALLRFLGALGARVDGRRSVRIIATRPDLETTARIERWLIRHPAFQLVWVSGIEPWKQRAVLELAAVGRVPTSARQFRGRAELTLSLARSLSAYRSGSGPFSWMARPSDVAEGEAAYGLRYDLAVTGHAGFKSPALLESTMPSTRTTTEAERRSARKILRTYLRLRAGERVTIESWTETLGYANAFVLETLRLGGRPLLLYQDEPTYWAATTEVPSGRLAQLGDHRKAALERTDVFVSFFGPSDRERFHSLPSPTLFRLGEYQDSMYEAAAKAGARSVQLAIGRVSPASARMYGVDGPAWREELLDATLVDSKVLRRRAAAVALRLRKGRELEISHPNGTRVQFRLKGRPPVVSDGVVSKAKSKADWNLVTLPAGVVTVALDESFADGTFLANVASSCGLSDTVGEFAGGKWTFARGRLARFAYGEGQELFAQSYGRAGRGRDRPASVSIGLNPRISTSPLLEDQGLGTISLNIGRNDHLGGTTRTPWWAWLFLRGGDLTVDGKAVVHAGSLAE
ncbi:MAG: hypothetical protein L3J96_04105, partial [Thermoplasmata archaeon]|nr:hypothetical protein [Thermoplasmata archaeon]